MRLGFAINVNISPDILVIDEALAVGDASFKAKCKAKIRQIIETGVTVLYVSHNATSVEEICERSIFLKKGKLMFDGPTREAHLIYLIDKRKSQIDKRKEKIAELNKVIESATDDMLLTTERESLEKHYEKIEEFKREIADYEASLEEFRKSYYNGKKAEDKESDDAQTNEENTKA